MWKFKLKAAHSVSTSAWCWYSSAVQVTNIYIRCAHPVCCYRQHVSSCTLGDGHFPQSQSRGKKNEVNYEIKFQAISSACARPSTSQSQHTHRSCVHACALVLSALLAPLHFHASFVFKSPCFRPDCIFAVKIAEVAFLTLLPGRKKKQSGLKVPITWEWWQIEEGGGLTRLAGCLHWLLPAGYNRRRHTITHRLINHSEAYFTPCLFNVCFSN